MTCCHAPTPMQDVPEFKNAAEEFEWRQLQYELSLRRLGVRTEPLGQDR